MEPQNRASASARGAELVDDPAAPASAIDRPPRPRTLVLHLLFLWLLAPLLVLLLKRLFG